MQNHTNINKRFIVADRETGVVFQQTTTFARAFDEWVFAVDTMDEAANAVIIDRFAAGHRFLVRAMGAVALGTDDGVEAAKAAGRLGGAVQDNTPTKPMVAF